MHKGITNKWWTCFLPPSDGDEGQGGESKANQGVKWPNIWPPFHSLVTILSMAIAILILTVTPDQYRQWKHLEDKALSNVWICCLAQNIQTYTTNQNKQTKNKPQDRPKIWPYLLFPLILFLDCKQPSPWLSGRWWRHWNKHHTILNFTDATVWIQHEKTSFLSFSA